MSHNKLQAGAAIDWIANAWNIFKKNPALLIGMAAVFMILVIVLTFIPLVGPIIAAFLQVMLWGGLIYSMSRLDANETLAFDGLFKAFTDQRLMVPMMTLAGISAAIALLAQLTVLATLLNLVYWFVLIIAIPLVMANGGDAIETIKRSAAAAMDNILPLIVFFALTVALGIAGALALLVGLLVVVPILAGAQYTASKEIFSVSPQPDVVPPPAP